MSRGGNPACGVAPVGLQPVKATGRSRSTRIELPHLCDMIRACSHSCRCLYTGEENRHGRVHRVLRHLDLFGSQTADRIPTPVVHGRGDHGTLRRQRPSSRTTLRVGTRNGPEGTARVSSRDSLSGELRRTRPLAQRREGPATGCGYPCDRRASYLRRSATEVVATVHEPVGSGGARGLDRQGPSLRKVAQRTHPAGHPQPHELPAQADSERQTAEEDQRDRRDFRQREGGAATGSQRSRNAGDLHGHQGEGGVGRLCSWGEKPGPTPTVK